MTLYIAYNAAISGASAVAAGQAITTAPTLTLQLGVPDNQLINIVEFGYMQDVATATAPSVEVVTNDTAPSALTAHSTTTVKPLLNNQATPSRLTMSTTGTCYGAGTTFTGTVLRTLHKGYLPQQYVYTWPLGQWPIVGNGTAENFVQVRIDAVTAVNALCWLIWDEA